jgi:predicted O-methyltransferase YrrM
MHIVRLPFPPTDPTPLFDFHRMNFAAELFTAAVAHFDLFNLLADDPLTLKQLGEKLQIAERPTVVLTTALKAMELLFQDAAGQIQLTPRARSFLLGSSEFDISDYLRLSGQTPGVLAIVERLRANCPATSVTSADETPWIFKPGSTSAMDAAETARFFTLGLAGRAKIVAPYLAPAAALNDAKLLVDVGGGTGIYAIACLLHYPKLRAIVWDRPAVLAVAAEYAAHYDVADRLELRAGDMFTDPVPADADVLLLSNILHDWDAPDCQRLIQRLAESLPSQGRLLIHDVYLHDALDGPLHVALYSAALFSVTEGRAYSAAEYRGWLEKAGLLPGEIVPTHVHCGILPGVKP